MTTPRLDDLTAIHQACWQQLAASTRDKAHAWRVMGLATVDGDVADLRSVVLREVDVDTRTLMFFTDARSSKVAQIRSQPQAALLFWSPALGWQLRLRVRLALDTSGLAVSSRWARLKMSPAAQDYLSPLPPGAPLTGGTPPPAPDRDSRNHFAVVRADVQRMDWLELHPEGHRRALFDADGNGHWVTP
ncbi:pyridoxamine 5'-phosphate oxidase family protein [Pseudaquabacterium pictum]|uniref:Pyridoxamine 5'-phosphate oxidase n=1 Tax=Pseudaquabacterium pictum TaxID=2315236 RepID=A0A480ARA4_9BURK|nr:pyridoxamine 5'-phosphate oxidase family protein [Rubrivivax pictus]GCL63466.1 pyridoxamine 5'-phosphate oxidase [Rubrivivax pictus]